MRKTIFPIIFTLCAVFTQAQQSPNPFLTPEGTRWQGRVNHKDSGGGVLLGGHQF
jgi:hypothetical protein